ncbi:DUF6932 family protein [Streptomyces bohaiensis]|uniref:DUF6932 family protein n=1 Tax=Streptomyces bohaiensis TaxID=1431344 RepID=UPI003B7D5B48
MPPLPTFLSATGCPPPGRYSATLEEVEAALVQDPLLSGSDTRAAIWSEFEAHRALIDCYVGSINRMWLAGSFVSNKMNPADLDVAYLLDAAAYHAVVDPNEVRDLRNLGDREWCIKHGMRVDAYLLQLPETEDFRDLGISGAMKKGDREAFQQLGLYDEIWQRRRSKGERRGYVEVTL